MTEIRLIKRKELDKTKWNQLVELSAASVYNQIYYLDSLAEHWSAIVYGDYKGAIAVPYTIRLGVKGIYTPNFIRAVDWMGEKPECMDEVEQLLKKTFTRSNLNCNQQLFKESTPLYYQVLSDSSELKLGSQSTRSIKKFAKTGLEITAISMEEALPLIVRELKQKVKDLREIDFLRFENLLLNYKLSTCYCFGIKANSTLHAASILIEWNNELLYIKGGVDEFGKQNGLMHALMEYTIKFAHERAMKFSFEGSNVDSVRQFNLGFGAKDVVYYNWNWNNSPWWFRILMKLRK